MADPKPKHHFHFKHTNFKLKLILALSHLLTETNSLSTSSDTGQLLNNCPTLTAELNDPSTGVFTGKASRQNKISLAIAQNDFIEEQVSPSVINYDNSNNLIINNGEEVVWIWDSNSKRDMLTKFPKNANIKKDFLELGRKPSSDSNSKNDPVKVIAFGVQDDHWVFYEISVSGKEKSMSATTKTWEIQNVKNGQNINRKPENGRKQFEEDGKFVTKSVVYNPYEDMYLVSGDSWFYWLVLTKNSKNRIIPDGVEWVSESEATPKFIKAFTPNDHCDTCSIDDSQDGATYLLYTFNKLIKPIQYRQELYYQTILIRVAGPDFGIRQELPLTCKTGHVDERIDSPKLISAKYFEETNGKQHTGLIFLHFGRNLVCRQSLDQFQKRYLELWTRCTENQANRDKSLTTVIAPDMEKTRMDDSYEGCEIDHKYSSSSVPERARYNMKLRAIYYKGIFRARKYDEFIQNMGSLFNVYDAKYGLTALHPDEFAFEEVYPAWSGDFSGNGFGSIGAVKNNKTIIFLSRLNDDILPELRTKLKFQIFGKIEVQKKTDILQFRHKEPFNAPSLITDTTLLKIQFKKFKCDVFKIPNCQTCANLPAELNCKYYKNDGCKKMKIQNIPKTECERVQIDKNNYIPLSKMVFKSQDSSKLPVCVYKHWMKSRNNGNLLKKLTAPFMNCRHRNNSELCVGGGRNVVTNLMAVNVYRCPIKKNGNHTIEYLMKNGKTTKLETFPVTIIQDTDLELTLKYLSAGRKGGTIIEIVCPQNCSDNQRRVIDEISKVRLMKPIKDLHPKSKDIAHTASAKKIKNKEDGTFKVYFKTFNLEDYINDRINGDFIAENCWTSPNDCDGFEIVFITKDGHEQKSADLFEFKIEPDIPDFYTETVQLQNQHFEDKFLLNDWCGAHRVVTVGLVYYDEKSKKKIIKPLKQGLDQDYRVLNCTTDEGREHAPSRFIDPTMAEFDDDPGTVKRDSTNRGVIKRDLSNRGTIKRDLGDIETNRKVRTIETNSKSNTHLIVKNLPANDPASENLSNIDVKILDDKGNSVMRNSKDFRAFQVNAFNPQIEHVNYNSVRRRLTIRGKCLAPLLFHFTFSMKTKDAVWDSKLNKLDGYKRIPLSYTMEEFNDPANTPSLWKKRCEEGHKKYQKVEFTLPNFLNDVNERVYTIQLNNDKNCLIINKCKFEISIGRIGYLVNFAALIMKDAKKSAIITTVIIIVIALAIAIYFSVKNHRTQLQKKKSFRSLHQRIPKDKLFKAKDIITDDSGFIGQGEFGKVYKGLINKREFKNKEFAIKTATSINMKDHKSVKTFLDEAVIGLNLSRHKHVLTITGLYMPEESKSKDDEDLFSKPCIVSPFMANKDMRSFLQTYEDSENLTVLDMVNYASDAAKGIQHLHAFKIIHRDIAARNMLLDDNYVLKIGDFGLAQKGEEYHNSYNIIQNDDQKMKIFEEKLPFAWLAVEVLSQGKSFGFDTDVWAYGVTIWEFFTRCRKPYTSHNVNLNSLGEHLDRGYRLKQPLHCPDAIYRLMLRCWHRNGRDRPDVGDIIDSLSNIINNPDKFDMDTGLLETYVPEHCQERGSSPIRCVYPDIPYTTEEASLIESKSASSKRPTRTSALVTVDTDVEGKTVCVVKHVSDAHVGSMRGGSGRKNAYSTTMSVTEGIEFDSLNNNLRKPTKRMPVIESTKSNEDVPLIQPDQGIRGESQSQQYLLPIFSPNSGFLTTSN